MTCPDQKAGKRDHTAQDAYALGRIAALPVDGEGWHRPRFRADAYGSQSRATFMRCVGRLVAAGRLEVHTPVASAQVCQGYRLTDEGRAWLNRGEAEPASEPALNRVAEPAPEPVLDSSPVSTSIEEEKKERPAHSQPEPANLNRLPEPAIGLLAGLSKRERERIIVAWEKIAEGIHLRGLAAAAQEADRPKPRRCGCGEILTDAKGKYGVYQRCPRPRCNQWKNPTAIKDTGGPRVDPARSQQERQEREAAGSRRFVDLSTMTPAEWKAHVSRVADELAAEPEKQGA